MREMLGGADGKGDSVEYGTASRRTRDKVGMWTTRRRPLGLGRQLACRARHYGEQALDGNDTRKADAEWALKFRERVK